MLKKKPRRITLLRFLIEFMQPIWNSNGYLCLSFTEMAIVMVLKKEIFNKKYLSRIPTIFFLVEGFTTADFLFWQNTFFVNFLITTLYLFDLFGFGQTFGIFHFDKLLSYKRVKWGRLAGSSHKHLSTIYSQKFIKKLNV